MSDLFKNSYIAPEKDLVSLSVCNVGYQKCEPLYTWGPGIRNHYLIHYVITGKGYFKVHGKTYELKSGDCFLVYPNQEILYYADQKDPWVYCWIGFSGSVQGFFGQAVADAFGSDEAVLGGVLMGEGIVEIVQQPSQAPDFLVLAQMPGKGAHDRFRGQRVLDEMFFGAEFVQKGQSLFAVEHDASVGW